MLTSSKTLSLAYRQLFAHHIHHRIYAKARLRQFTTVDSTHNRRRSWCKCGGPERTIRDAETSFQTRHRPSEQFMRWRPIDISKGAYVAFSVKGIELGEGKHDAGLLDGNGHDMSSAVRVLGRLRANQFRA